MRTLSLALVLLSVVACGERDTLLEPSGVTPCDAQMRALVDTRGVATGIGGLRPDGSRWHRMDYGDVTYFFEWGGSIQGCQVTES